MISSGNLLFHFIILWYHNLCFFALYNGKIAIKKLVFWGLFFIYTRRRKICPEIRVYLQTVYTIINLSVIKRICSWQIVSSKKEDNKEKNPLKQENSYKKNIIILNDNTLSPLDAAWRSKNNIKKKNSKEGNLIFKWIE